MGVSGVLLLLSCASRKSAAPTDQQKTIPSAPLTLQDTRVSVVRVEEFLDLMESYSVRYYQNIHTRLKQEYGEKITFHFYPLVAQRDESLKKLSEIAARSVYCAGQQNRMEAYILDYLEHRMENLSESIHLEIAQRLSLNLSEFQKCQKGSEGKEYLTTSLKAATEKGLMVVPSVFVQDSLLAGLKEYEEYRKYVEFYLHAPSPDDLVLTVLYDPSCTFCDERSFLYGLQSEGFPLGIYRLPADSPRGQQLISTLGIPFLPAILFNQAITSSSHYTRWKGVLVPMDGYYFFKYPQGMARKYLQPIRFPEEHILGSPNAPLTVYEFLDFQCPACKNFYEEKFPEIKKRYVNTNKVKWVVLHYPLTHIHPDAYPAAVASECADQQNVFWSYHDLLFQNLHDLSRESLIRYASRLPGLSVQAFLACLEEAAPVKRVQRHLQLAEKWYLAGTPSIFIGPYLVGNLPLNDFITILDQALSEVSKPS